MNEIFFRLKKHYWPVLLLVFIAWLVLYFIWTDRDEITFTAQATGYISIILLAISLLIGPVNLLMKFKYRISTYFRRDLSIIGGVLALVHSTTGLFVHLRGKNWQYFFNKTDRGYSIRLDNFGLANYSGLLSALIIILLLVISNDYFLNKLNSANWKNVQRLSYVMFILVLIHSFLYRIVKENTDLIYSFYIPLFLIVLAFQLMGVWIKVKEQKNSK